MGMPQKLPHLPHPAVNWDTTKSSEYGKVFIQVTCPSCSKTAWQEARNVAARIRKGTFSGYCYQHRRISVRQRRNGYPSHPCIDWSRKQLHVTPSGQRMNYVAVTCPKCQCLRWCQPAHTAVKVERGQFSGDCKSCCRHAKKTEWVELSPGRKVDPKRGYVRLAQHAVPTEYLHLWNALAHRHGPGRTYRIVFEHRFVMSVILGRAITKGELVDHMDGIKINNDPSNLRLYRRGKNDPGDTNGYGTFYHEWQTTLAELNRLKATLGSIKTID